MMTQLHNPNQLEGQHFSGSPRFHCYFVESFFKKLVYIQKSKSLYTISTILSLSCSSSLDYCGLVS